MAILECRMVLGRLAIAALCCFKLEFFKLNKIFRLYITDPYQLFCK